MNIIFMGTPFFAQQVLDTLINLVHVKAVVTQPDKKVGRKNILVPSPVKEFALKHNIKVFTPLNLKEDYKDILKIDADMIITCAYGQMIPQELLNHFPSFNIHASLLPLYRGGAPIERAIMNNENKTGITLMKMSHKMDRGDILYQEEIPILKSDTKDTLTLKLINLAQKILRDNLSNIFNLKGVKQKEIATCYAPTIKREEELIDFQDDALNIFNKIRALDSKPGAYAYLFHKRFKLFSPSLKEGEAVTPGRIKDINDKLEIETKNGLLLIGELQEEGKKRISVKDYFNGQDKEKFKGQIFNE